MIPFVIIFLTIALVFSAVEVYFQLIFVRSRNKKIKNIRNRLTDSGFQKYTEAITASNIIVRNRFDLGYALCADSTAEYDYAPLGEKYRVDINNLGIRHPVDIDLNKYDSESIILLGDSVCFGSGVDFDKTLGAYLEKELLTEGHNLKVFNFAVGGYSILDCLGHFYFRKAPSLNPKTVIYFYTIKSIFDFPRTNDPVTGFHIEKWPISFLYHKFMLKLNGGKVNYLLKRMSQFIADCNRSNIRFIFCELPAFYKESLYPANGNRQEKYEEAVDFARKFAVEFPGNFINVFDFFHSLDYEKFFRRQRNDTFNEFEVHLSAEGNHCLADYLKRELW